MRGTIFTNNPIPEARMNSSRYCLAALLMIAACTFTLVFPADAIAGEDVALTHPIAAKHGMIVTGQDLATQAGLEMLKNGGNAIDAAVTAAFVMAVTLPRAGNIGGGGFMLIYSAKTGETVALDFWQKAPGQAYRTMFLGSDGKADQRLSRQSYRAIAVPGTVAGLAAALEKFGTRSFAEVLAPAVRLANDGFILNEKCSADIKAYREILGARPATARIFFRPDGSLYQAGERFVQKDLARTLQRLAENGPQFFYRGDLADLIVRQVRANDGLLSSADLRAYAPVYRKPARGTYRGHEIVSMGPPSSGGVHLIQMLNMLEPFDIAASGHNSTQTIHLMAEAMKRAFADLSRYLGDPDFVSVPVAGLTSKNYAKALSREINPERATPGMTIQAGSAMQFEREETTHFSVVDKEGNAVASTYTLNGNFGSGIVVDGAGFLLNNEMDNFNLQPGKRNASGIVESEANAVGPDKRMLSAMSPTFILKNGKLMLITGSPGSNRIITTNLQVIMNVIDHRMNIQEAVNAPRVHHEWLPDELRIEKGLSPDTVRLLREKGHTLSLQAPMGASSSILIDPETRVRYGASDPRREGSASGY